MILLNINIKILLCYVQNIHTFLSGLTFSARPFPPTQTSHSPHPLHSRRPIRWSGGRSLISQSQRLTGTVAPPGEYLTSLWKAFSTLPPPHTHTDTHTHTQHTHTHTTHTHIYIYHLRLYKNYVKIFVACHTCDFIAQIAI